MQPFKFTPNEDLLTLEVIFSGELVGGTEMESEKFQKQIKQIRLAAESRLVYLNLNEVTFWDTEGMRQILGLAHEINVKFGKRVHIIAPKEGYLYARAFEKYKDKVDVTIPWVKEKIK